ncbi:MAG: hypothetical protein C3F13_17910 [Anaerolineales bacterium]|nr:MAG: hypothetical protein C3F13_17910 [Anaerolineales bacterium]
MVFLVLKAQMDFPLTRSSLFVTLIETCAIVVTTLMLVWVRNAVHEFESAVNQISDIPQKKVSDSALEKQSVLYREVRRARNHQRPLVLLAIGVEEKSIQASMERLLQEAQQNFIRQYTLARVSKTLCEKLEDCDLVVQTDNNFLILLPETKLEDLSDLTDRLRNQVSKDIGVEIQVGAASLPHDGFTFEGLVDKANLELQANMESKLFIEPEQLFVKHKVT